MCRKSCDWLSDVLNSSLCAPLLTPPLVGLAPADGSNAVGHEGGGLLSGLRHFTPKRGGSKAITGAFFDQVIDFSVTALLTPVPGLASVSLELKVLFFRTASCLRK